MPAQSQYNDVINSLLSDHYAQRITINMTVPQKIRCYKGIRNVSEATIIGLCSLIQNESRTDVFQENDMEKKWNSFYSIFNYYFNLACPKLDEILLSSSNVPSINNDVITARTKPKNLYEYDLSMQSKIHEHRISIKHIKRNTM
jgi:hypothetical protein